MGDTKTSNVYIVNMFLRNNVGVSGVKVTEGEIAGADMLIGMDIINMGDFAITNLGGQTTFSFRMPSIECIDFVKKLTPSTSFPAKAIGKVGRNDPCPCGSKKKYKKCCLIKKSPHNVPNQLSQ